MHFSPGKTLDNVIALASESATSFPSLRSDMPDLDFCFQAVLTLERLSARKTISRLSSWLRSRIGELADGSIARWTRRLWKCLAVLLA